RQRLARLLFRGAQSERPSRRRTRMRSPWPCQYRKFLRSRVQLCLRMSCCSFCSFHFFVLGNRLIISESRSSLPPSRWRIEWFRRLVSEGPTLFFHIAPVSHFSSGVNSSFSSVSTTNTASSLAGSVLLAFSSTVCRSPGISEKFCPARYVTTGPLLTEVRIAPSRTVA